MDGVNRVNGDESRTMPTGALRDDELKRKEEEDVCRMVMSGMEILVRQVDDTA